MKQNTFSDIPRYLNFFRIYLGNKIFLIFFLMFIAALFESVGILMLLPLLEGLDSINSEVSETSSPKDRILTFISSIILRVGFVNPIIGILFLIIIVFILKGLFFFLALAYNAILRARLLKELKSKIYFSSYNTTYQFIANENYGKYVNLINDQANKAVAAFSSLSISGLSLVNSVVYVFVAMAISFLFGAATIVAAMFIYIGFKTLNTKVRTISTEMSEENGWLADLLISSYENFGYLVSTSKKDFIQEKISISINKITSLQKSQGIFQSITKAAQEPLAVSAMIGILIFQVAYFNSSITPLLVSIALFYRGVNSLIMVQSSWQNCLDLIGGVELIQSELSIVESNLREDGNKNINIFENCIELKEVDYKIGSTQIIKNINCKFVCGQTYGIVGESGSGKSTLAYLLLKLIQPSKGKIFIDDEELSSLTYESYGNIVGYIPQESIFIEGSIIENITMTNNINIIDYPLLNFLSRELNLNQVFEVDEKEKEIYEHKNINNLSGGQKQRLSILRELYSKKSILIMDEPTSAQDVENEKLIKSVLSKYSKNITLIIITHKQAILDVVDHIYKMSDGKLLKNYD